MTADRWTALTEFAGTFTCYSSALGAWAAVDDPAWPAVVDSGLHLVLSEEPDGLFGFSHFPPGQPARERLRRMGTDDRESAVAALREELGRSGRVIVAGDGFHLPWHVACGRRHVPHWFTLVAEGEDLVVQDPFECRVDLGWQRPNRRGITPDELPGLLEGLPAGDPVLALREAFALGDDARPLPWRRFGWLVLAEQPASPRHPRGVAGPDAVRRLARHFREQGQRSESYRQADDLWSVGRHRAFVVRRAEALAADTGGAGVSAWTAEHGAPLAARWTHVAPLLMQARLAIDAGRAPSQSLAEALEELADRESAAAEAFPADLGLRPPTHP
jgi:hypothetical protein